jgi:hypothetical protein
MRTCGPNVSASPKNGIVSNEIPPKLRVVAHDQAGLVSRPQAVGAGLSRGMINYKIKFGRWQPVHRGVYATFSGPLDRRAHLWGAVLYAGPGAYLSHQTAAEINKLTDDKLPVIHVSVPGSRRVVPPNGVAIHGSSHKAMIWHPPGIPPYTIAERTVIDLVQTAARLDDIIALVTLGFGRGQLEETFLRRVAQDHKKLRWRRELDEIITAAAGGAHSVLEFRYDRDVERAHGLPAAKKQVPFTKPDGTRGFRDRYYDAYGLAVELDGKRFHDDRRDHDRRRDNDAVATTGATLRYTWDDVTRKPCATAAQVHAALRGRGYPGALTPCGPHCRAVAARAAC